MRGEPRNSGSGGNAAAMARSVLPSTEKEALMKSSTQDRVEGTAKDVKGAAKQQWGKATRDTGKRIEGSVDRVEGKVQKAGAEVKRQAGR